MPVSGENCQEGRGGAQACIVLTRTYLSEASEVLGSGNQDPPWFSCSRVSGEPVPLGKESRLAALTSCLALACPAQVESRAPDSERAGRTFAHFCFPEPLCTRAQLLLHESNKEALALVLQAHHRVTLGKSLEDQKSLVLVSKVHCFGFLF